MEICAKCECTCSDIDIHNYNMSLIAHIKKNKGIEKSKTYWNRFGWWHWHELGNSGITIQFFKWLWIITVENEFGAITVKK